MAFSVKTHAFAATTGTTSTVVTGIGFQPKAIIFVVVIRSTNDSSSAAGSGIGVGFTDGTNHRYAAVAGANGVATSDTARGTSATKCIGLVNSNATLLNEATCTFDSDGFTLTWNSNPAIAYRIIAYCFGGTDITNVAVGTATMLTSTGSLDVNVGFVGDVAFFLTGNRNGEGLSTDAFLGFGVACSASKECAFSIGTQDGATMSSTVNAAHWITSDSCIHGLTNGGVADFEADFVSFDQGGGGNTFRLNFSNAAAALFSLFYLVIKGGQWDCGTQAKPTTAVAQSVTGMAFQPTILGLGITPATALDTIGVQALFSVGGATSTSTEIAIYQYHNDAINTVYETGVYSSKCLLTDLANTQEKADFTSFNSDGWTITWDATGSAAQVCWWAAAAAASAIPQAVGDYTLGPTGALSTQPIFTETVGGYSLGPTATVSKMTSKTVGGYTQSPVGDLIKMTSKTVGDYTLTPTGVLTTAILFTLTVGGFTLAPLGTLATIVTFAALVGGYTLTPLGSLVKMTSKSVGDYTATLTGALTKMTSKTVGDYILSPTGALARATIYTRTVGGFTLSLIGELVKMTSKTVGGFTVSALGALSTVFTPGAPAASFISWLSLSIQARLKRMK
jgi:hypothetical protein